MTTGAALIALGIRPRGTLLGNISLSAATFNLSVAAGTVLATISGKTAGSTLSLPATDGVLVLSGDQTQILRGLGAVTAGAYLFTVVETLAPALNSPKSNALSFAIIAPTSKLSPSANWTGVVGSGLDFAGVNRDPALPLRTVGKPVLHILSMDRCAITGDLDIWFTANRSGPFGAFDLAAGWENALTAVTDPPIKRSYVDVNGATKYLWCYKVTLDGAAAQAMHGLGAAMLVIKATPKIASRQSRTVTATYYPRLPLNRLTATAGVQATGYEYDIILDVAATTGTDLPGATYYDNTSSAMGKAQGYINSNNATYLLPGIRFITDGGNYRYDTGASVAAVKRETWAKHFKGAGVSTVMLGDGVHFSTATFGQTSFDGMMLEQFKIDRRQVSPAFAAFRMPIGTNNLIGFNGCEIYDGSNLFGDANASGAGMTSLYRGLVPPAGLVTTQDLGQANLHLYDCHIHDFGGPAVLYSKGPVRGCNIHDISGSLIKNVTGPVHGNTLKRNGGFWSGLRKYYPMIQLAYSGASPAPAYMVQGVAANNRTLSLTEATPTAWGASVTTTASRIAIPSSGGAASGKVLYIATVSTIHVLAGDSSVTALGTSQSIASPGGFVTLAGTETHISAITISGTAAGVTVLRSVFDMAIVPTAASPTLMTDVTTAINDPTTGYHHTDAAWSASNITPANASDPVLAATYMGADLHDATTPGGHALATPPTPVNSAPTQGAAGVIYCWVDQHGECFFLDNGDYENISFAFNDYSQIVFSNIMQINGGSFSRTITASINGNVMNVTAVSTKTERLRAGLVMAGAGVTLGTTILSQISGVAGGVGTYLVSTTPDVSSISMTATGASSCNDLYIGGNTCCSDDVQVYGLANFPSGVAFTGFSGGVLNGVASHCSWENNSWTGGTLTMSAGWTPDALCWMSGMAAYEFGGTPAQTMAVVNSSFGAGCHGFMPAGADASCALSSLDDTLRFAFIPTSVANESTPPDYTPKATLILPDGTTVAGAFNLDGTRKIAA